MGNPPISVRIYAAKDPEIFFDYASRAANTKAWGVRGRTVYSESRNFNRVFYYPVSPRDKSAGLLIGIVGDPASANLEEEIQESRHGEGAIVDVTKQLGGKMDNLFLLLNRAAKDQKC